MLYYYLVSIKLYFQFCFCNFYQRNNDQSTLKYTLIILYLLKYLKMYFA